MNWWNTTEYTWKCLSYWTTLFFFLIPFNYSIDQVKQQTIENSRTNGTDLLVDSIVHVRISRNLLHEGSKIECFLDIPGTSYSRSKDINYSSEYKFCVMNKMSKVKIFNSTVYQFNSISHNGLWSHWPCCRPRSSEDTKAFESYFTVFLFDSKLDKLSHNSHNTPFNSCFY